MYRFEKYGSLWHYKGIPMYAGKTCISPRAVVWWWPWNWVLFLAFSPCMLWQIATETWQKRREKA